MVQNKHSRWVHCPDVTGSNISARVVCTVLFGSNGIIINTDNSDSCGWSLTFPAAENTVANCHRTYGDLLPAGLTVFNQCR